MTAREYHEYLIRMTQQVERLEIQWERRERNSYFYLSQMEERFPILFDDYPNNTPVGEPTYTKLYDRWWHWRFLATETSRQITELWEEANSVFRLRTEQRSHEEEA